MSIPEMRPYQKDMVEGFVRGEYVYLGAEQGLGKSRVAIEIAKEMRAKKILVICPLSVRQVWKAEFRRWWPESPNIDTPFDIPAMRQTRFDRGDGRVAVINYDKFSRAEDFTKEVVAAGPWDLLILDEAQCLKTPGALRTRAIFGFLINHVKRTLCLSGTPAPNHAGELFSSLRALAPQKITRTDGKPMSLVEFENAFCLVEEKRFGSGRPVRVIKGSKNMLALKEILKGFLLRKTKKEVLKELPPLEFATLPLAVSPEDVKEISALCDSSLSVLEDDELLRALRGGDENFMRLRRIIGLAKARAAIEYLQDFLYDSRAKIVVWAIHHDTIDRLMSGLADYNPVKIDGRDSSTERVIAVESFLELPKHRVFVGQIQAAGTGLTLIGPNCPCSDVFFVESPFVPGDLLQAACRVHRIGQNDGVLARIFLAEKTIDERIQTILTNKTEQLEELLG